MRCGPSSKREGMPLKIVPTAPEKKKKRSPSSRGHHGVEEQVSLIAPRTPLKPDRRMGMKEQASCPVNDPMRLAL